MKRAAQLVFAIFLTTLVSLTTKAQDYVITSKGDSLTGAIKIFSAGPEKKIMINENKKKTYLTLFQVKTFRFKDEIYQPVKGPNGYAFMKLVKPGYVSLLAFQMPNQMTYDGLYLLKRDGTGVEVPNLSFKKAMKKFLSECNAVLNKLENDIYGRRELEIMLDEYNQCIEANTSSQNRVIIEKRVKSEKMSPWAALKQKVEALGDFSGKTDALEMINEITNKISRSEKVPNFMIEGLKTSLKDTNLQADLEAALGEIN